VILEFLVWLKAFIDVMSRFVVFETFTSINSLFELFFSGQISFKSIFIKYLLQTIKPEFDKVCIFIADVAQRSW
jgi:hypothetical protein